MWSMGCAPYEVIESILPYLDQYLMDIKHMNPQKHKEYDARTAASLSLLICSIDGGRTSPIRYSLPSPSYLSLPNHPESQEFKIQTMMVQGKPKTIGEDVTVGEVMETVEKDRPYYRRSSGGLTLSGGESLCQPDFARDLFHMLSSYLTIQARRTDSGFFKPPHMLHRRREDKSPRLKRYWIM